MSNENIRPWVERYKDRHGNEVVTVGVDTVEQQVIYRRPGYEHDCACPRRDWSKKFRKVES